MFATFSSATAHTKDGNLYCLRYKEPTDVQSAERSNRLLLACSLF